MKLDQLESIFILLFGACFMHVASLPVLGKKISTTDVTSNPCPRTEPRPSNGRILGYVWVSASDKERLCCLCNLNETMVDPCLKGDVASIVCVLTETESTVKETTATTTSITRNYNRTASSTVLFIPTLPTTTTNRSFEVMMTTTTGETITPVVDEVHPINHGGGSRYWYIGVIVLVAVILIGSTVLIRQRRKQRKETSTDKIPAQDFSTQQNPTHDGTFSNMPNHSSFVKFNRFPCNSRNIDTENMQLNANNEQESSAPLLTRTITPSTLISPTSDPFLVNIPASHGPLAIVKKYFRNMIEHSVNDIEEKDVLKFARCFKFSLSANTVHELQKKQDLTPVAMMIEVLGLIEKKIEESISSGSDDDVISDAITYFKNNNLLTISDGLEHLLKSENTVSINSSCV